MRKIKVIRAYGNFDYDENYHSLFQDGSTWQEVSDEDFIFIRNNLYILNRTDFECHYILVEEDKRAPITGIISDIKSEILKTQQEADKKKKERERIRKEAAEKRRERKLVRDRKALEKLIIDNPDILESFRPK